MKNNSKKSFNSRVIYKQDLKIGYAYILEKLDLKLPLHWHISYKSLNNTNSLEVRDDIFFETYHKSYWPQDNLWDHLEFAIKYDGVNLLYLTTIFTTVTDSSVDGLVDYINTKKMSKYSRKIWFFYEFLTGNILPIEDLKSGNYVDALDSEFYYVIENGKKNRRQRIVNNLLGTSDFCPIVRRTANLKNYENIDFLKKCENVISSYSTKILKRALCYFYNKETKSSFEIENIVPSENRVERFVNLLMIAEKEDFVSKHQLIDLQNKIVDQRFADKDYRTIQNYIGQSVFYQREIIHYICPSPQDLPMLMDGLINVHALIESSNISPIIHAAIIAYSFVFMHPFEDGNGRIHRFLIHNILARRGLTPKGLMFPISAVMLKNNIQYDFSLESFSKPLLGLIDYSINDAGEISVYNDTKNLYRYIDLTIQVETLFAFVIKTIEEELVNELSFLVNYDKAKQSIQQIIDMSDRLIDLFIKCCTSNGGTLSKDKRKKYYKFLTDKELIELEKIFRKYF